MTESTTTVYLLDVDNTLLDNDAVKKRLDEVLRAALTPADVALFWRLYEEVRAEMGLVSFPTTLERFLPTHHEDPLAPQKAAESLFGLDFAACLRPRALELVEHMARRGIPVILSNGDQFFQRWKIRRCGLAAAVDGRVWVFPEKEHHFDDLDRRFGPDARFVLVDDKPRALRAARAHWGGRVTTVLSAFGHHAEGAAPDEADLIVASPAELLERIDELGPAPKGRRTGR